MLRRLALRSCTAALTVLACFHDNGQQAASAGGTDATAASTTGEDTTSTTATASTTTTGATGSDSGTSPTTGAATTSTTSGVKCPDVDPMAALPNGSACGDHCECQSQRCFEYPTLGGVCGECLSDADCSGGGCTAPVPAAVEGVGPTGATCNKGQLGGGCMSDGVCADTSPACADLYEIPGLLDINTCSECRSDADCVDPGKSMCVPNYDIAHFGGHFACTGDKVPNNSGCVSNAHCASNICTTANLMGLLQLGVCGACGSDGDCVGPGEKCVAAAIDINAGTLTGSTCVVP